MSAHRKDTYTGRCSTCDDRIGQLMDTWGNYRVAVERRRLGHLLTFGKSKRELYEKALRAQLALREHMAQP